MVEANAMVAGAIVLIIGLLVLQHGAAYEKLFVIALGTVFLALGITQAFRRRGAGKK